MEAKVFALTRPEYSLIETMLEPFSTLIYSNGQNIQESKKIRSRYWQESSSSLISLSSQVFEPKYSTSSTLELVLNYPKDSLYEKIRWYNEFVKSAAYLNDASDLYFYYRKINEWQANKNYSLCDEFIKSLDTQSLSITLLVGLPRLIFKSKYRLDSWNNFLKNIRQELKNRKYDDQKLLRGLDQ